MLGPSYKSRLNKLGSNYTTELKRFHDVCLALGPGARPKLKR
jgi:hypothetical protein